MRYMQGMAWLSAAAALMFGTNALAKNDFADVGTLSQSQFRSVGENLAAATVYKGVIPAEPLGATGFDIALGASSTSVHEALFDEVSNDDWNLSTLPLVRANVHKGLPFGIDLGASYGVIPGTDISVLGAEVRYAVVSGNAAVPAVGLRASYSKLQGVDEIELDNKAIDISISKGFVNFTPYVGIGQVFSTFDAPGTSLNTEDIDETRVFAGVNINFGINLTLEMDSMAGETSYSAKTGIRF